MARQVPPRTSSTSRANFGSHQDPSDTQAIKCGCLSKLPPNQKLGFLALHVHHGRGIKSLLVPHLQKEFREDYEDHVLLIKPWVAKSAFEEAIEKDLVSRVRLLRYVRPSDAADQAMDDWIPAGQLGTIELGFSMKSRKERLQTRLLKKLVAGTATARRTSTRSSRSMGRPTTRRRSKSI